MVKGLLRSPLHRLASGNLALITAQLLQPAPVCPRLRGVEWTGTAVASGDEQSGVTVEVELDPA